MSWQAICHPKSEWRLDLKDMYIWNQTCMIQNMWDIIVQFGSLWIAWLQEYVLKDKSFWQQKATSYSSWVNRMITNKLVHELEYLKQMPWKRNPVDLWTKRQPDCFKYSIFIFYFHFFEYSIFSNLFRCLTDNGNLLDEK